MNIVYLLTNLNKTSGKRFYLGSKLECNLIDINGVQTIIDRTGKPYLGSSSCHEMRENLKNGEVYEAEIIEIVPKKALLRSKEQSYLEEIDAMNNEEYHNMTNNAISNQHYNRDIIVNKYGETQREYSASFSGASKRINRAIKLGFKSYKDFILYIEKESRNKTLAQISRDLNCERHSIGSTIKGIDLQNCVKEFKDLENHAKAVEACYLSNASPHKMCFLLDLELPTVLTCLENFSSEKRKVYTFINSTQMSKLDLSKAIIKKYLNGNSLKQIAIDLNIDFRTVQKYFDYHVKKSLKNYKL